MLGIRYWSNTGSPKSIKCNSRDYDRGLSYSTSTMPPGDQASPTNIPIERYSGMLS